MCSPIQAKNLALWSHTMILRGLRFGIRSGSHTLRLQEMQTSVVESDNWQGTIIYLKLRTDKEINPADVVANRTNVAEQYNELFLNDDELEELW